MSEVNIFLICVSLLSFNLSLDAQIPRIIHDHVLPRGLGRSGLWRGEGDSVCRFQSNVYLFTQTADRSPLLLVPDLQLDLLRLRLFRRFRILGFSALTSLLPNSPLPLSSLSSITFLTTVFFHRLSLIIFLLSFINSLASLNIFFGR